MSPQTSPPSPAAGDPSGHRSPSRQSLGCTVAVLGAGIVGRTLSLGWARTGHRVLLGSRTPASDRITRIVADLRTEGAAHIDAMRHAEAAAAADVAVITVTGGQVPDLISELGGTLDRIPAIDTTNDLTPSAPSLNALDALRHAGAIAYRAFNTIGWEQMQRPAFGTLTADLPYTGPASHAPLIHDLIADIGFRPVHLGDSPRAVDAVDQLARLWFLLAFERGYGRRVGFRFLTADDEPRAATEGL